MKKLFAFLLLAAILPINVSGSEAAAESPASNAKNATLLIVNAPAPSFYAWSMGQVIGAAAILGPLAGPAGGGAAAAITQGKAKNKGEEFKALLGEYDIVIKVNDAL